MPFSSSVVVFCGAFGLFIGACGRQSAPGPTESRVAEHVITDVHSLVSAESGVLARPVAIAVGEGGAIYVLDQLDRRVVVISRDGDVLGYIGGPGSGPGEFARPVALGLGTGKVYVYDSRHRNIQVFSLNGEYLSGYRAEIAGAPLAHSFSPEGRFAYASFPVQGGLVRVIDGSGQELGTYGNLVTDEPMRPETLLEEVHQGRLPGFMRNRSLPSFSDDGSLWLFIQSEGVLQSYSPAGMLATETDVQVPEIDAIKRDFFRWYADQQRLGGIRFLDYLDAMEVINGTPWLLWKLPPSESPLVTVHDSDGHTIARLILAGVKAEAVEPDPTRPNPPGRRFAVDPFSQRLYIVDSESAVLSWASLPQGLLPEDAERLR